MTTFILMIYSDKFFKLPPEICPCEVEDLPTKGWGKMGYLIKSEDEKLIDKTIAMNVPNQHVKGLGQPSDKAHTIAINGYHEGSLESEAQYLDQLDISIIHTDNAVIAKAILSQAYGAVKVSQGVNNGQ